MNWIRINIQYNKLIYHLVLVIKYRRKNNQLFLIWVMENILRYWFENMILTCWNPILNPDYIHYILFKSSPKMLICKNFINDYKKVQAADYIKKE